MDNLLNTANQYFHQIRFLIDYCPTSAFSSRLCHQFWMVIIYVPLGIVSLFLLRYLITGINDIRAMKRLEKMKTAQLIVADVEVLDKLKWKGLDLDLPEDDLALNFREALKANSQQ